MNVLLTQLLINLWFQEEEEMVTEQTPELEEEIETPVEEIRR